MDTPCNLLIKGMFMIKLVCTSMFLMILAGCSSSPIKDEDKIDLTKYVNEIKESCLKTGKYKDRSEKGQITLCTNDAERAMDVSQDYFWLYQEKNVLKKCDKLLGKEFSDCAIAYQAGHYDATTKGFIKKMHKKK